jgi:hypothetical protein
MYLTQYGDHMIIKRPENSANNLIIGTLYVDMHGKMEVTNLTTGSKADFYVHRQGWTKKNSHKVEGKVIDGKGNVRYEVHGLWNKELSLRNVATGEDIVVFRVNPLAENHQRQYGFCPYTIQLNYLDDEMKKYLPPTDTRRRGD